MEKGEMKMERIKNVLIWVLLFIIVGVGIHYAFSIADDAWENRAKAAGYYDTLSNDLKNPKDIK